VEKCSNTFSNGKRNTQCQAYTGTVTDKDCVKHEHEKIGKTINIKIKIKENPDLSLSLSLSLVVLKIFPLK
jgi:hypothetical protein